MINNNEKYSVLIVCAGLGTRLKNLTKYVNKTLLPINNNAIISHIIKMFPSDYEFVITLGYKGESIKEYCEVTFPTHNFKFVNIDKFEGDGTGPGYSALQCKEHLKKPFYFVMGDCLIDSPIPNLDKNWLGVYETSYPEKYSTVKIDNGGNIISVMNKNVNGYDLAWIGIGGIKDYVIFWDELEKNIMNGEIVSGFEKPLNFPSFKVEKMKWLDTGNLDDLEKAKLYFKDNPLSIKKDIGDLTYKENNKFIKFVCDKKSLKDKVDRASILKDLIPYGFGYNNNFIYYNWVNGKSLYEYDRLDFFVDFLKLFGDNLKLKCKNSVDDIKKFYINKTKNRVDFFREKYPEKYFNSEYHINGTLYRSMSMILDNLNYDKLFDNSFYALFHGDLQFDNIIFDEDKNKYYYIDWRDNFGDATYAGDVYYDLGKLYGGLIIPYNIMKNDSVIDFKETENSVNFSYPVSKNIIEFKKIYEKWIIDNSFELDKVKFIAGLIHLNMSPLHDGNFGKMLWFKSVETLSKYLK